MGLIKPFFLGFTIVEHRLPRRAANARRHPGRRPGDDERGRGRSVAVIAVDFLVTKLLIVLMY